MYFGVHYVSGQVIMFLNQSKPPKSILGPLHLVMHLGECLIYRENMDIYRSTIVGSSINDSENKN